tara:strand:+ start:5227 stop:5724 length:498 start_codon:yes stop_codon:yes gene_type:complete
MKDSITQFKLTNNEEIICEVVQWPDIDDIDEAVVVKKALKVVAVEDYMRGMKFFAFRPWMSFQDDPGALQTLNATHIIATTKPSNDILKYYKACIRGIAQDLKKHGSKRKAYTNLDEIQTAMRNLNDDEMDDYLEEKYGHMTEESYEPDSDDNNIIQFKPKKTLH